MKEFVRNKKTGILEIWENGKKISEIITMGDEIINFNEKNKNDKNMSS